MNQVQRWRGLFAVEADWRDEDCDPGEPDCSPCWPRFNSCRLTAEGEQVARRLLEHRPEYCNFG